jgi:putative transcriptional regulator
MALSSAILHLERQNIGKGAMIRCHLSRMMGERKMKIADVARECGLHRNMITLLYNETASRVELDTIERLCRLFECKVGDLFEMIDNPKGLKDGRGGQHSKVKSR